MIIHPDFAGIDISKNSFDVFDGRVGKPEQFANAKAAAQALGARFKAQNTFVLFEATGRYDQHLRDAFDAIELPYTRITPSRARDFAKATGQIAKTDAIDARMLAAMAQSIALAPSKPRSQPRTQLSALQLRRDQLVDDRIRELGHKEAALDRHILAGINRHLTYLANEIAKIQAAIEALVASDEEFAKAAVQLRSIPGIGLVTTSVLLALMPELGKVSPQQIAALAGLAPYNVDSGSMRGQRHIRGGRQRVRNALYMAAVSTIRGKTRFATFYEHLVAKGKPTKLALTAVARKILLTANAMLRDNLIYCP